MKKRLSILLAVLLALSVCAFGEETEEGETFAEGDFEYRLLDDGTAEITYYEGEDTDLEIPSELGGAPVTAIGDGAFFGGDYLQSVTIPDSVTTVDRNPFFNCTQLTRIVVSPDHPTLATIDGVLFSKADKRLICYPYAFEETTYEIPQGIAVIGDNAFSASASLNSIIIPDSVAIVDRNPFVGCENLTQIVVSPGHPVLATIDGVLFSKADKRLICYPCAFDETTYEIPQGIRIIGDAAFESYCSVLESIAIPDSVTTIGKEAFSCCGSLESITIPGSVTDVGDEAFAYCEMLASVTISEGVTRIGRGAFMECHSLGSIVLPGSLQEVGERAFYACSSLYSVKLSDGITAIGRGAFYWCDSLEIINIPDSVTTIEDFAFSGCEALESLAIPDSVTTIGDEAFDGYTNLTLIVGRDSYAKEYAEKCGIAYTYPDANDWLNS